METASQEHCSCSGGKEKTTLNSYSDTDQIQKFLTSWSEPNIEYIITKSKGICFPGLSAMFYSKVIFNLCHYAKKKITTRLFKEKKMEDTKVCELSEKIVKLMESYNIKVYDFEYVNELIEKTILREEKECSY